MKFVEGLAVQSRTGAEGRAELEIHVGLVAIAEVASKRGQRAGIAAKGGAETDQPAQALEGAQRNARLGPKGLGHTDRVAVGERRELAQRPPAAGLVTDRFDDPSHPVAAFRCSRIDHPEPAEDLGSKRGHRQFLGRLGRELEGEAVGGEPKRGRADAVDALDPRLPGFEVQVHAHGPARAEPVVMRLSRAISEDSAAFSFDAVLALDFAEAAVEDDADIIVGMSVGRDFVGRPVRGQSKMLAAGSLSRDHVEGDAKAERAQLVCHHGRLVALKARHNIS
jgi:hypothetical protein